jgi:hypothetical protein
MFSVQVVLLSITWTHGRQMNSRDPCYLRTIFDSDSEFELKLKKKYGEFHFEKGVVSHSGTSNMNRCTALRRNVALTGNDS